MLSNPLRLNFYYLKRIHIFHPRYNPKITYLKKYAKEQVRNHDIIRLIIMKVKMKMKNKSHRYDTNRRRSRHGHKYSKYTKCLTMMMMLTQSCIKQHRGNIRSSHQRCSVRKGTILLKKRLWHRCFPVNFVKFLRTPFSQNSYWRLLLQHWG